MHQLASCHGIQERIPSLPNYQGNDLTPQMRCLLNIVESNGLYNIKCLDLDHHTYLFHVPWGSFIIHSTRSFVRFDRRPHRRAGLSH